MKAKRKPTRRLWTILLILHTLIWLVGFTIGIHFASLSAPFNTVPSGIVLMLWTLPFIGHVVYFYRTKTHNDMMERERQAYRDGYDDAIRHFRGINDHPYDFAYEEDHELLEMPMAGKRKRME